jgi:hypothetical protein
MALEQPAPDNTVHVRLDPQLIAELRRRAVEEERPLSQVVRRLLRQAAASQQEGRAA